MSKGKITKREEDLLTHEWETVIHYWASDNSVVLIWSSIFMLVNSILLGSLLSIASEDSFVPSWILKWVVLIAGIAINIIWFLGISRFIVYLRHFHDLVMNIQAQFPLLRFQDPKLLRFRWHEKISTKPLFQCIPIIFFITWIVVLVALIN